MKTIPFGMPLIGEEEKRAVAEVLEGPILVHGPRAKEFENSFASFCGAHHATSVSSCTAGLHLAYFTYGIGTGDEVIVPAQTHNATAHAVELSGAKPVFVDSELVTGNIDINAIEAAITERTRAISIVHYLGMPVDMDRVNAIASRHNLIVIEDCALAVGTYYKGIHAGLHGDVGCFSFYPVKHMTTAEGGMFLSKHEEIVERVKRQKAFGVDRTAAERSIPGVYDVTMLGFNYRMSEVHAAIGIEQVKRLPDFLARRRRNHDALLEALREIPEVAFLSSTGGEFISSYYCFSLLLSPRLADRRFDIVATLKEKGIGPSIYYPRPVPHFQYYRDKYGFSEKTFPAASRLSYESIALPVGPHLVEEDMLYIAQAVKEAVRR